MNLTDDGARPDPFAAPWHRASYDRFLYQTLPALLADRLPLAGYAVTPAGEHACRIAFTVAPSTGRKFDATYDDVPRIAGDGTFTLTALRDTPDGPRRVVPPVASAEDLEGATVRCVGEQMAEEFGAHLEGLPADLGSLGGPGLRLDAALRHFLPLSEWFLDFFNGQTVLNDGAWRTARAQRVDPTNWMASRTHLRRILVDGEITGFHPGQVGRACYVETPEGPNIGRVLTVARGATIRDGRFVPADPGEAADPADRLGLAAACIPLLRHSSDARLLMGANMMRQWHTPPDPEPALVRSGLEPQGVPEFWCGRNLLTAFVSWGVDTHEDAVLLSESAARKLSFPHPLEPGDKLSHRHGAKGAVGRIVPDAEMPHLTDGTAVEIVYSFTGLPSRLNHGQVLEAVLGRVAKAEGRPIVGPPFGGPTVAEMQERLAAAGLARSGMESLRAGKDGPPLARRSTVGWVYWGRTAHDARDKLRTFVEGDDGLGQRLGPPEYRLLREAGALHTIHALFTLQAQRPADAAGRPERFHDLTERLRAAGVSLRFEDGSLAAALEPPAGGGALTLAAPVPHPWLPGARITALGARDGDPAFERVRRANARLVRLAEAGGGAAAVPESLRREAAAALEAAAGEYVAGLLTPADLAMRERVRCSGRTVAAPGAGLGIAEVGLPDAMAWDLFGPLLARDGRAPAEAVAARTPEAAAALDARLAASWVLVNRQPSLAPAPLLALRPVRLPAGENVIRLHPFHCPLLDADFDGDQIAVFLPATPEAQSEIGERLTPLAHVARDRELLSQNRLHAALWGLASLSREPGGLREIEALAGIPVRAPMGFFTKSSLDDALRAVYDRDGAGRALEVLESLYRRGFELARASGASFAPFVGESLAGDLPPAPPEDAAGAAAWDAYGAMVADALAARAAAGRFSDDDVGAVLLACASGARGTFRLLARYIACTGSVDGSHSSPAAGGKYLYFGAPDVVRHSLRDGLTPGETVALMAGYRRALKRMMADFEAVTGEEYAASAPAGAEAPPADPAAEGLHLLARALRSADPGRVLALGARAGETDPLTGADSRLFVGLPPGGGR